MLLPDQKILNWLVEASQDDRLIGKDALTWRTKAKAAGVNLEPILGGFGRGNQKIRAKAKRTAALVASSEMAEMASSWQVSQHRFKSFFSKIEGTKLHAVVVPASGAGMDAIQLFEQVAQKQTHFWVGDIDPLAVWVSRHNFLTTYPNAKVHFCCNDAFGMPFDWSGKSYAFMDPARRKDGQRLAGYSPALSNCMALLETFDYAQIKLSPGESILELQQHYPAWSWEVIQFAGEIKEISGSYGLNNPLTRASQINFDGHCVGQFEAQPLSPLFNSEIEPRRGDVIAIPEICLKQSGLLSNWEQQFELVPTPYEQMFIDTKDQSLPLARKYRFHADFAPKVSMLKQALKPYSGRLEFRNLGAKFDPTLLQFLNPTFQRKDHEGTPLTCALVKSQHKTRLCLLEPL